ncbi:UNKNOWN [Stylonychia lemnae]|uniref:Uncharacterized protein n=1 Tax=Stylonychia lemnae TaxID=5949 RepID=A0A078B101_STYLE|nr:UNKNOWN [Stylonychia lemnae]|eukprot:CDW86768.1 UNKNOWN [Stylonychia lemnae]
MLLTPISPCKSATSCLQIASPRPVPPYLRVVERSAWAKDSNTFATASTDMPMPVSLTSKRSLSMLSACS